MDRQIGLPIGASKITRSRNDSNPACISTNPTGNRTLIPLFSRKVERSREEYGRIVLLRAFIYAIGRIISLTSRVFSSACAVLVQYQHWNQSCFSGSNLSYQPLDSGIMLKRSALATERSERRMLVFLFPRPPPFSLPFDRLNQQEKELYPRQLITKKKGR